MNKSNEENDFITFDDLKFEPYDKYPSFSKRAFLTLDNGIRASVLEYSEEEQERHGCKYGIILRDNEFYDVDLGDKGKGGIAGATTDKKLIEMLNVASKFTYNEDWACSYGNYRPYDNHYKEYINLIEEGNCSKDKSNEEKEFITCDDLKFEPYKIWGTIDAQAAWATFDLGALHIIRRPEKNDKFIYDCMRYAADDNRLGDAFNRYDKESLNDTLRECQCEFGLNKNDKLPKEQTKDSKSSEKEDRAKQSLDRIRAKKKSVSGAYVADKIGEAMRSGVISEPVTPEKGKQLSDNIKKKYIMDQQQKS